MSIVSILNKDLYDMLYGRDHIKHFKIIVNLFKRLSEVAELVFFEDGPVLSAKYETWLRRHDDRYNQEIAIIDRIEQGCTIQEIADGPEWEIATMTSGLQAIEKLAKKYGRRIVTVTMECDAELAQYACNNPSVIAVLADDTDFLIFPGKWKYFSVLNMNVETLTTMEYSRTALRNHLNLNDKQLLVLSTIAGNDIVWNRKGLYAQSHNENTRSLSICNTE
jgi:hypothetical protein